MDSVLREDATAELPGAAAAAGGAAASGVGPLGGALRGTLDARAQPEPHAAHSDSARAARRTRAASDKTGTERRCRRALAQLISNAFNIYVCSIVIISWRESANR